MQEPGKEKITTQNDIIRYALGDYVAQIVPANNVGSEDFSALTIDEKRAIKIYTGCYYKEINDPLRNGTASPQLKAFAALLDLALTKSPKYKGRSIRVIQLNLSELDKFLDDHRKAALNAEQIEHEGFFSSSLPDSIYNKGNVVITVDGESGVFVKPLSSNPDENEVLFKKGSMFYVDVVIYDNVRQVWRVDLREESHD